MTIAHVLCQQLPPAARHKDPPCLRGLRGAGGSGPARVDAEAAQQLGHAAGMRTQSGGRGDPEPLEPGHERGPTD